MSMNMFNSFDATVDLGKAMWIACVIKICEENDVSLDGIEYDTKVSEREDTVGFYLPEWEVGVIKVKNDYGLYCAATERGIQSKAILSDAWDHFKLTEQFKNQDSIFIMVSILSFLSEYNTTMIHMREKISSSNEKPNDEACRFFKIDYPANCA